MVNRDRVEKELLHGLTVDTSRPEQPILLDEDGRPIKTWRENYPYDRKIRRREYERIKRILQIEMLKLQRWTKDTGARVVVVCEGRDAALQGRHHPALHRTPQPPWRPHRRPGQAHGP